VEGSRQIRASVDKAITLDPRNDLAWHVLGRWHQVVADVSGVKRALGSLIYGKLPPAKNEDAVACFQKAISLNPNRPMHYIELGRTYANMGRPAEARRFIEKGLGMPDSEQDDREIKRKGRETLQKLG
jgi:Tfp pilus assembly protein PilF